jgi:hypothetical protein
MRNNIEVAPYIDTNCSERTKNELYKIPFDYKLIANPDGVMPIKSLGFLESNEGFEKRLSEWLIKEEKVIFEGWICKNMFQFQEIRYNNIIITLEQNNYEVSYYNKVYNFPFLPETIDDFINDLKRIGITLFWKEKIVDIYGIENLKSSKKIIDFLSIFNRIKDL